MCQWYIHVHKILLKRGQKPFFQGRKNLKPRQHETPLNFPKSMVHTLSNLRKNKLTYNTDETRDIKPHWVSDQTRIRGRCLDSIVRKMLDRTVNKVIYTKVKVICNFTDLLWWHPVPESHIIIHTSGRIMTRFRKYHRTYYTRVIQSVILTLTI